MILKEISEKPRNRRAFMVFFRALKKGVEG
jgi:hypothetical protein